jgi:hypothetical protein
MLDAMAISSERRLDLPEATLVWGNASRWKATLREEAERGHLERPPSERLRRALDLVLPRVGDRERAPR